jgi:hypothetical protein
MGFRLVYAFLHLNEKKKFLNFFHKGGPLPKKSKKKKNCLLMTIHKPIESTCEILSICVVFKFFILCIWSKIMEKQFFYAYFCNIE